MGGGCDVRVAVASLSVVAVDGGCFVMGLVFLVAGVIAGMMNSGFLVVEVLVVVADSGFLVIRFGFPVAGV